MSHQRPGDTIPFQPETEAIIDKRLAAGSGIQLVDLGVVDIVDLLDGPQTLYTPSEPVLVVQVAIEVDTLVLPDSHAMVVTQGTPPFTADPRHLLIVFSNTNLVTSTITPHLPVVWSDPVLVGINTGYSGYFVDEALEPWAPDTTYGATKECIIADGFIWSSSEGTTGSEQPDFAGSPAEGAEVVDGTVTWTNEDPIPTVGSAHFYALVGKPS